MVKYDLRRYEFSFDFQDGVTIDDHFKDEPRQTGAPEWKPRRPLRHVVDFCCGKCLEGHKSKRKEEEDDSTLEEYPDCFEACEIRKKSKNKLKAAAKKNAKDGSN